ncbi:MAG: hypothetical protein ACXVZ4_12340, partial [Gaiellaceae bacterium]
MTEATLDRVHVRCRAPREQAQEALDLRARLVTTARLHLPQALEHALDDRGGRRVFVDRLDVPLDFDPRDYDDVTVAALWAGRVAQALAELDGAEPGVRVFADTRAFVAAALAGVVDRGVLDPVFAELGAGVGPVEPVRFLAAFDRASRLAPLLEALAADEPLARSLYARLRPDERRAVAAALRGETPWGDGAPGAAAAARDRDAAASGAARGAAPDGLPAAGAPAAGGRRRDG